MIVPQGEFLSPLVLQVEDELGIFSVLSREDVFSFENWSIETTTTIEMEDVLDGLFYVFAAEHLARTIVSRALVNGHILVSVQGVMINVPWRF